jgi:membrane dipeptidase
MRIASLASLLAGLAGLLALPVAGAETAPAPVPVVDLRVHLPYQLVVHGRSLEEGSGQAGARRLRRGGAIGVVLPLLGARGGEKMPSLDAAYLTLVRALGASAELRRPGCRTGSAGIRTWLAIEGADELARAPSRAAVFAQRGVKLLGLVRDEDNDLATSNRLPGPVLTGLTPRGVEVVKQAQAEGMLVDVSHASEMTVRDVVELARRAHVPVVASHSNARAVSDDPRNLTDDELSSIASTGGVVGVELDRHRLTRGREADLHDVVRHVRHVASVAGIEHVAIGSGYEGGIRPPPALVTASRYQRLAAALQREGVSRPDVRRVMALNALRVLCTDFRRSAGPGTAR